MLTKMVYLFIFAFDGKNTVTCMTLCVSLYASGCIAVCKCKTHISNCEPGSAGKASADTVAKAAISMG